jgi:hypothetical protein
MIILIQIYNIIKRNKYLIEMYKNVFKGKVISKIKKIKWIIELIKINKMLYFIWLPTEVRNNTNKNQIIFYILKNFG